MHEDISSPGRPVLNCRKASAHQDGAVLKCTEASAHVICPSEIFFEDSSRHDRLSLISLLWLARSNLPFKGLLCKGKKVGVLGFSRPGFRAGFRRGCWVSGFLLGFGFVDVDGRQWLESSAHFGSIIFVM